MMYEFIYPRFQAEIKSHIEPVQTKNNAQTTSKQLQTNFQKVQKTTFLAPKMVKSRVPILTKVSIFGCILDLKPQILPQKCSNQI